MPESFDASNYVILMLIIPAVQSVDVWFTALRDTSQSVCA